MSQPTQTDREKEVQHVLYMIDRILKNHELSITYASDRNCLAIIDNTTGKRYGIVDSEKSQPAK